MSTPEKMIGHYESLKSKHDLLDKQIEEAYNHHEDDLKIQQMKNKKLHLKEQMFEFEKKLGTTNGKTILHGNKG